MKRPLGIIGFLVFCLTVSAAAFSEEKKQEKDAVDATFASLRQQENPAINDLQQPPKETLKKDDFTETGTSTASAANTSSSVEATVKTTATTEETIPAEVKEDKKDPKPVAAIAPEVLAASANATSDEMERNWKALFSKEAGDGSIMHTVESGDSLYVLAIKNHTTVDLIKKINGLKRDTIYPGMKLKINTAPFSILVSKSQNTLLLFLNGKPVKKYSVATGKQNCTPTGTFKINAKLIDPTWFKTGTILPPGSPENALGTRWLGFDKPAYGIHGTIDPKSIGTQASEGCVRMLNEDVEELYSIVPVGTQVTIQD